MKYSSFIVLAALFASTSAIKLRDEPPAAGTPPNVEGAGQVPAGAQLGSQGKFAPPALGPYASDTDHLSAECYGADEDDIMYDVFARYRVEERNPQGAGTGVYKLPKYSGPNWAADIIKHFNVMDEDKVDAYVAANFDNFWHKYDNNGTGEIYESEGETFMRALLGPNNRFRLAPGALSDLDNAELIVPNRFSTGQERKAFVHRYPLKGYARQDDGTGGSAGGTTPANPEAKAA